MIVRQTTSETNTVSELLDLLIARDKEIADLKAGSAHMEKEWNRLQDWIQVLTEAHTYYRQMMTDAVEAIDADDAISAYWFLREALDNMDYKIEWKEWEPKDEL